MKTETPDIETLDVNENDDLAPVGYRAYRKAIVAGIAAALVIAATLGVDLETLKNEAVAVFAAAGAIATYLVPNEQGVVIDPQDREQVGLD